MPSYEFGPFSLDVRERCLMKNGRALGLYGKPFDVLVLLVENTGHLITKEELMQTIWPYAVVEEGNLTVCISKIRKHLGERKGHPRYIATLRRRGYRFITDVRKVHEDIYSIAVLPFDTGTSGPEADYLTDGLTESLIFRLARFSNLKVSPRSFVFPYKNKKPDPKKIASRLGVNLVLSGNIVLQGECLTISTELLNTRTSQLVWGKRYHRRMSDMLAIQCDLSREITEELVSRIPVAN